jgi:hypothetical protein
MASPRVTTVVLAALGGCFIPQQPASKTDSLIYQANVMLGAMRATNPGLDPVLDNAYAFAVFPRATPEGIGQGVLYQRGKPVRYVDTWHSPGTSAQGGPAHGELVLLRDASALANLEHGYPSGIAVLWLPKLPPAG